MELQPWAPCLAFFHSALHCAFYLCSKSADTRPLLTLLHSSSFFLLPLKAVSKAQQKYLLRPSFKAFNLQIILRIDHFGISIKRFGYTHCVGKGWWLPCGLHDIVIPLNALSISTAARDYVWCAFCRAIMQNKDIFIFPLRVFFLFWEIPLNYCLWWWMILWFLDVKGKLPTSLIVSNIFDVILLNGSH